MLFYKKYSYCDVIILTLRSLIPVNYLESKLALLKMIYSSNKCTSLKYVQSKRFLQE